MLNSQSTRPSDYVSTRVFDGVRTPSKARAARAVANYKRTHTTTVYRLVSEVRRVFGMKTC